MVGESQRTETNTVLKSPQSFCGNSVLYTYLTESFERKGNNNRLQSDWDRYSFAEIFFILTVRWKYSGPLQAFISRVLNR